MDVMMKAIPAEMMAEAAKIAALAHERSEAGTWTRGNVMLSTIRVDEATVWRCRTTIGKTGRINLEGQGKTLEVAYPVPSHSEVLK